MAKDPYFSDGNPYKACKVSVKLVRERYEDCVPVEIRAPWDFYVLWKNPRNERRDRHFSFFLNSRVGQRGHPIFPLSREKGEALECF